MNRDAILIDGTILKCSRGFYRVRCDNGHEVLAHISGRMRKHRIRIIIGDRVSCELTPYDWNKARIVYRYRD